MRNSTWITAALFIVLAAPAHAETAFQFSVPNFQAPRDPDVNGVRLSILYGKNRSQRGLDLGILSMSETQKLSGLALIGGLSKVTGGMSNGVALSGVNWHTGTDSGLNAAFVNILDDASGAFNIGFVTVAERATMIDLGGFNMSRTSKVQIGFLNVTDRIETFQFGFLNMARNGFLPFFPIFNFPKN